MIKCRICNKELQKPLFFLGSMPPSNFLVTNPLAIEKTYPLDIYFCDDCNFLQIPELVTAKDIFAEGYPYFSGYSQTWLDHCRDYVNEMIKKYKFTDQSLITEIGSNDGSLLQYFKSYGIQVLGIDPVKEAANVAISKGIPTEIEYFDYKLAEKMIIRNKKADLIMANNVIAHNPNLHDFVKGLKMTLKKDGVVTIEFPWLLNLIQDTEFDSIYHEHYSYFSLFAVRKLFRMHRLDIFNAEYIQIHGGSLRIYIKHIEDSSKEYNKDNIHNLLNKERELYDVKTYLDFSSRIKIIKVKLLDLLNKLKKDKKLVVGYAAAAKANSLINYCGIGTDLIKYIVDANPHKQGRFMPGSHIPIYHPDKIKEDKPDYIVILAWNLKEEIMRQLEYTKEWNCSLIIPIPIPIVI